MPRGAGDTQPRPGACCPFARAALASPINLVGAHSQQLSTGLAPCPVSCGLGSQQGRRPAVGRSGARGHPVPVTPMAPPPPRPTRTASGAQTPPWGPHAKALVKLRSHSHGRPQSQNGTRTAVRSRSERASHQSATAREPASSGWRHAHCSALLSSVSENPLRGPAGREAITGILHRGSPGLARPAPGSPATVSCPQHLRVMRVLTRALGPAPWSACRAPPGARPAPTQPWGLQGPLGSVPPSRTLTGP